MSIISMSERVEWSRVHRATAPPDSHLKSKDLRIPWYYYIVIFAVTELAMIIYFSSLSTMKGSMKLG
jgi:hypothetical protein